MKLTALRFQTWGRHQNLADEQLYFLVLKVSRLSICSCCTFTVHHQKNVSPYIVGAHRPRHPYFTKKDSVDLFCTSWVPRIFTGRAPITSYFGVVAWYRGLNHQQLRENFWPGQAARDHKRSAEDSFVHRCYWTPSVVTGK